MESRVEAARAQMDWSKCSPQMTQEDHDKVRAAYREYSEALEQLQIQTDVAARSALDTDLRLQMHLDSAKARDQNRNLSNHYYRCGS